MNICMGAKWVNLPYSWDQLQGNYIAHLDLFLLIIYRPIPEEQFKAIAKPLHQNIMLLFLIRSA